MVELDLQGIRFDCFSVLNAVAGIPANMFGRKSDCRL
jgi:hypothetical protein